MDALSIYLQTKIGFYLMKIVVEDKLSWEITSLVKSMALDPSSLK